VPVRCLNWDLNAIAGKRWGCQLGSFSTPFCSFFGAIRTKAGRRTQSTVGSGNLTNFLPQAVSAHSFKNFKML
jgi:hypothetical protein